MRRDEKQHNFNKLRYVPISQPDLLREAGVFFTTKTLYRWHCERRYPKIFRKVAGKVFLDLQNFFAMFKEGQNG